LLSSSEKGAPDPGWISLFKRDEVRRRDCICHVLPLLPFGIYQQEGPPRWQGSMARVKG